MRTPRLAILVLCIFASLFVLFRSVTSSARANAFPYPARPKASKSVMGFVYSNTPFSLFPPNAAISLTDDNSTSFAARPAAFGPKLAAQGLSGELWVGKGFPDDSLNSDGELGCSDLVAWETRSSKTSIKTSLKATVRSPITTDPTARTKRSDQSLGRATRNPTGRLRPRLADVVVDDGTDDYLHAGLGSSSRDASSASASHADIQSIQEAAEIKGKVVLLMRGGCGFLQKVMWAQRRGALAVIVGDNQKGGPLIQMFAQGDEVENVTIPSVFTARTTAHLLSSLTLPGSFLDNLFDENGTPILRVQRVPKSKSKSSQNVEKSQKRDRTTIASSENGVKARQPTNDLQKKWATVSKSHKRGWLSRLLGLDSSNTGHWNEDASPDNGGLKGGSITPGSGEYQVPDGKTGIKSQPSRGTLARRTRDGTKDLYDYDEEDMPLETGIKYGKNRAGTAASQKEPATNLHEGLWVTITPTSSASSFFDTLLVLVISPLITLTVVYALLLLRARIRRRRWRAPKSVVERLPVRTYQAVTPSPSRSPTRPPRAPSPSSASPTTPLLQHSPRNSRPRSRTTSGSLDTENIATPSSAVQAPEPTSRSSPREHEKGAGGFSAEWRKYMGRQVECVVCLEEYVDGVSRVMSLPCGHEFHVDCM
jgi:hypothetical protein